MRASRSLSLSPVQLFSVTLFVLLFGVGARHAVNLVFSDRFELVDFSQGPGVDDDVVEIVPLPSHLSLIALCGFECPLLLLLKRVMRDTRCRVHAQAILELYPTSRIFILFPLNLQRAACTGSSAS